MKLYMAGPEKGDCLIEVTAWAGLTVYNRGRRCRGRMVIGYTNTYTISAYHH